MVNKVLLTCILYGHINFWNI